MYVVTLERAGEESDLNYFTVTVFETAREATDSVVGTWTDERIAEDLPAELIETHETADDGSQAWSASHSGTTWVFTIRPFELGVEYRSELL